MRIAILLLLNLLAQYVSANELLWQKLNSDVTGIQRGFDGVMGIAIRDLTDGHEILINADEVFPTASSIKISVLAELYRQSQTGQGARLSDRSVML